MLYLICQNYFIRLSGEDIDKDWDKVKKFTFRLDIKNTPTKYLNDAEFADWALSSPSVPVEITDEQLDSGLLQSEERP